MFFVQSIKKSKAMIDATKAITAVPKFNSLQTVIKVADKKQEAFDRLFNCMLGMCGFSDILKKHCATAEDLCHIADRIFMAGYTYQGRDFLPVALVSFGKPLDYVLTDKDLIINNSFDEIRDVVEVARTYL